MTAKRSKSRRALSHDMLNEALAEPDVDGEYEDDDKEEHDSASTRRPQEKPKKDAEAVTLLTRAEQLARICASLGVATAAILGVIEYRGANDDKRSERSMEIVRDWQSEGMIDRYARVQLFVEAKYQDPNEDIPPSSLTPEALRVAYSNLGYKWSSELRSSTLSAAKDLETDIDRLMLYFAQMEICIDSKLCNADVLRAYFQTEVISYWDYFEGYARLRREANYEDYGAPVGRLVDRFEQPPVP